jgi:hypothetical protein
MPEFTMHLEDSEAGLGKNAHFECEINSSQSLDVRFFKGTKEIFEGMKYRVTNDGLKYKLVIFNVSLDDEDEYSVKARNKAGSKISRAYLTVTSKKKFLFLISEKKKKLLVYC